MDDIKNILLNVIASFIFAGIVWWWRRRKPRAPELPPDQPTLTQPDPPPTQRDDWRAANRQKLHGAFLEFLFYFTTFAALYYSLGMPPLLKAFFGKQVVFLSDARIFGTYLPHIPIGKEFVQMSLLIFVAILYIPLLHLAEIISGIMRLVLDPIYKLAGRRLVVAQMWSFFVLCLPVATTSVWLFYPKTLQESFATVLGFLALFAVLGLAQGRR
jgi:hypothetical protein